ncbi:MAG TPA: menaquinone biosynthesis protein, partial [Candidatus Acidoferrales bacterium]|nr:menaquinone biosynthesis protein [Candidatus Acidoferrales bacterium]
MNKPRISIVEFLNTAPLVWGFTDGPLAGRYDLSFTVPSLCAEALRAGQADVAIIPAIEYQRIPGLVALPGMAVAARGEVRSILVVARKPIELAKRIALDTSSRSSVALVKLLCRNFWGISPEFVDAEPDPAAMLASADAALVIGDPALHLDPATLPFETLDLGAEWTQMTGLPMIFALWAGRKEVMQPRYEQAFLDSCRYGLAHLDEIVREQFPIRGITEQ